MHYLFVAVALALELDGGVLDPEAFAQERLGVGEDLVVAAAFRPLADDDQMAAQGYQAAGDGPDVQIVHRAHARDFSQGLVHVPEIEVRGKSFEKDVDRFAAEADRAPDDGPGDEEADDRIRLEVTGERDDPGGEEDADGVEQISREMEEGRAQVHARIARV